MGLIHVNTFVNNEKHLYSREEKKKNAEKRMAEKDGERKKEDDSTRIKNE